MDVLRSQLLAHRSASAKAVAAVDIDSVVAVAQRLASTLQSGGKIIAAGNGGSAAQAQHLVGELIGRFTTERPGLAALALGPDAVATTAIANDYAFAEIFTRPLAALGRRGDTFVVFSTSGESANLVRACEYTRTAGISVAAFIGSSASSLARLADVSVAVPDELAATVQEVHLAAIHMVCQAIDWCCV